MLIDLSGKVALVTGAGRYVGAEIARTLAGAGAAVACNDIRADAAEAIAAEIGAAGGRAIPVAGDVTDLAQVEGMVAAAGDQLGPISVLVNNAGIPPSGVQMVRFRDMPMSDWAKYIDINLYAVLYTARAVIDSMCEQRWGRIVTITSEAGRMGMGQGLSVYGAAKAGAAAFSRNLAHEVGRYGVTVNCVSLGMMDNNPARDVAIKATPLKRQGRKEDVGGTVCFLASDHASFITGQTVPVNGGYYT